MMEDEVKLVEIKVDDIENLKRIFLKLAPSEKFIFYLLERIEMLGRSELIRKTRMSDRTIGWALRNLIKKRIIERCVIEKKRGKRGEGRLDKRLSLYKLTNRGRKLIGC